jgi:hypothetical protein
LGQFSGPAALDDCTSLGAILGRSVAGPQRPLAQLGQQPVRACLRRLDRGKGAERLQGGIRLSQPLQGDRQMKVNSANLHTLAECIQ